MRRSLYGWMAGAMLCLGARSPILAEPAQAEDSASSVEDLVFFTEDTATEPRIGCDAVSVATLTEGVIHFGTQRVSPGRMAGTAELDTIVAIRSNGMSVLQDPVQPNGPADFYISWRDEGQSSGWNDSYINLPEDGWSATFSGGLAITPDRRWLLAAAQDGGPWSSNCGADEYGVIQLDLADLDPDTHEAGPVRNVHFTPAPVAEILLADHGRVAHILVPKLRPFSASGSALLLTVDSDSLDEIAPPIQLPDLGGKDSSECGRAPSETSATISPDERYVVINHRTRPEIVVADLRARNAWTLPLRGVPGLAEVGGVAFDHSALHRGLFAVHGLTTIAVFEWMDDAPSNRLAYATVSQPLGGGTSGPRGSLAWSGDGRSIIAAQGNADAEFGSWTLSTDGRSLEPAAAFEVCANRRHNHPNDVLTSNGIPRAPSPTPSPSPSSTVMPSPRPSQTSTPKPSSTATALPSPTIPPQPRPVLLPLLLREICVPEYRRVAVALVMDASTSMLQPTGAGRSKLEAARAAAREFLDQLHLERGDRAAVVAFNADALILQPLTAEHPSLVAALNRIQAAPQTCLVCGIETGMQALAGREPTLQPVIIVLTDGRSNPRPASEAVAMAERAKADGIVIFTIGMGEDLDVEALEAIASRPIYAYRTPNAENLSDIYRAISVALPCPRDVFWGRR